MKAFQIPSSFFKNELVSAPCSGVKVDKTVLIKHGLLHYILHAVVVQIYKYSNKWKDSSMVHENYCCAKRASGRSEQGKACRSKTFRWLTLCKHCRTYSQYIRYSTQLFGASVQLLDGMYSWLPSIEVEAKYYMEICEPNFSFLKHVSTPARR